MKCFAQTNSSVFSTSLTNSFFPRRQVYMSCKGWKGTSEAEGMMPGQRVRKACLVVVLVDSSHTRRIPTAAGTGAHNGVAEAAVG